MTPPRYLGSLDRDSFLSDLELFAELHIDRRLARDLALLREDFNRREDFLEQEIRNIRRAHEEVEDELLKIRC